MATPVVINPLGTAQFIVREADGYMSREEVVIAAGAGKLQPGHVLGKITASGKYVGMTAAAGDGSNVAAALLFEEVDATAADVRRTVIIRLCEVQRAALAFSGTPTTPQKTTAYGQLATNNIVFR
jgi:hypothetical protein